MSNQATCFSQYIIKVASRCNLNCSYCYVYNQADTTWRTRTGLMSSETYEKTIMRILKQCQLSGQKRVTIIFHGGEPCLVGATRLDEWCGYAVEILGGTVELHFSIQTNGTLLNNQWAQVFQKYRIDVGISMDGPQALHDSFRVDHLGHGSYEKVIGGIELLRKSDINYHILSVIPLGVEPLHIHDHFTSLGPKQICYLLPTFTYDNIEPVWQKYGRTPCADFLIPIFDRWWYHGSIDVKIREFWNIARVIMGGDSLLDSIGNRGLNFIAIESNGEIHSLDKLRACEDGLTNTGLSIYDADFEDVVRLGTLHSKIVAGMPLPTRCKTCIEATTCGGGYLPHRYSRYSGFNNPSVWCSDILKIFEHMRKRLNISSDETRKRREILRGQVELES